MVCQRVQRKCKHPYPSAGSLWHTDTDTETYNEAQMESPNKSMYIHSIATPAEFLRHQAFCQNVAQYLVYWLTEARSCIVLLRGILGFCAKALPPLVQSLDKLFRMIMNEPTEQTAYLTERKKLLLQNKYITGILATLCTGIYVRLCVGYNGQIERC